MGGSKEEIAASTGCNENGGLGSSKAHHVGISTTEDRGDTKSEVGEDTGCEEGSVGRISRVGSPLAKYAAGL
jgi:hypothetical protein